MSNDSNTAFKEAVAFIRKELGTDEHSIGSSHAHQAIAAYCGYNSKKALKDDDNYDFSDPSTALNIEPDREKLDQRIEAMKDSNLKQLLLDDIEQAIYAALAPPCEVTGEHQLDIVPVYTDDIDEPDGWVSEKIANENDEEYGYCTYCGSSYLYRTYELNSAGECHEHAGESDMSEEERSGWGDYIENINKDYW